MCLTVCHFASHHQNFTFGKVSISVFRSIKKSPFLDHVFGLQHEKSHFSEISVKSTFAANWSSVRKMDFSECPVLSCAARGSSVKDTKTKSSFEKSRNRKKKKLTFQNSTFLKTFQLVKDDPYKS